MDTDVVSRIDWHVVLAPFPTLRELVVLGHDEHGKPHHILERLNPDNAPAGTPDAECVVFPVLQILYVEGFSLKCLAALVPAALKCLERRGEVLRRAKTLAELGLTLHLPDGDLDDYPQEAASVIGGSLSHLVDALSYHRLEPEENETDNDL
ncbi:hypothetical protein BV20DRAFT_1056091 [Pilatotrama ljubarskyi]|nr:hypothetical protein BV20DRAFT_1056091 [Pilatotrama ljubarskyi]